MISLDQARTVIAATRAKGREMNLNPLTVVVLDAGGHLVAMEREDGSGYGRPDVAGGKAAGALAMKPTAESARNGAVIFDMVSPSGERRY